MGLTTGIEWADATWNPWTGCTPVSEGCEHCYMAREARRFGRDPWQVRRSAPATFRLPLAKRRDGSWKIPPGARVFVCSWSDFFHPDVPHGWRMDALNVIAQRPDLVFMILTKRPELVEGFMQWRADSTSGDEVMNVVEEVGGIPLNVWLGVTAENQARADERVPQLLTIYWPRRWFVSIEPMLGPVSLRIRTPITGPGSSQPAAPPTWRINDALTGYAGTEDWHGHGAGYVGPKVDWVIVGGESGPGARPVNPAWVRHVRDECTAAGVPFFFKQWGGYAGRRAAGWMLDGREWREVPRVASLDCG